jgi:hypothetical protein
MPEAVQEHREAVETTLLAPPPSETLIALTAKRKFSRTAAKIDCYTPFKRHAAVLYRIHILIPDHWRRR